MSFSRQSPRRDAPYWHDYMLVVFLTLRLRNFLLSNFFKSLLHGEVTQLFSYALCALEGASYTVLWEVRICLLKDDMSSTF